MTNFVNINESRPEYAFLDAQCIGRRCFHAANNHGKLGCANKALHGCPEPLPEFDADRATHNKANGWRVKKGK